MIKYTPAKTEECAMIYPMEYSQIFKPYIQFNESLYLHWIQDERAFWYI